ncbi:MAG: ATP-binding protein [Spirochaetia bacterium]|nr:ATP-binding protein [Spirochaetia bacterium]
MASPASSDGPHQRLPPLPPDVVMAMADKLRAPLVGITSILDQSAGSGADHAEELALAGQEAARLLELVSGLSDYARIREGTAVFHAEHFNLASSVESVASSLSHLAAGKNITLDVGVPIIEMRNDLKAMHQVLFICLHCVLLSAGVRRVHIIAESDIHLVKLAIRYDGQPLPSHQLGWIVPGVPVEAGPVIQPSFGAGGPIGIELNLAAWFCVALGGSLHVEREAGQNIINLDLPRSMSFGQRDIPTGLSDPVRRKPKATTAFSSPATAGLVSSSLASAGWASAGLTGTGSSREEGAMLDPVAVKGRALVIDGEPVSLFALKRRMELAGWLVHAMVSATEAIAWVEDGEIYTVIIVDSRMPEMSGFDFCNRIRTRFGKEVLPVILMLDSGHSSVIDHAFRSGANDYLIRPVGGIELEARIKTHVDLAASLRRELDHRSRMAESDKYRTLAMLTAGVAHEINTPNNATLRNIPILREIWIELAEALGRLYEAEGGFNVHGYDYNDLRRELPAMLDDVYMGAQHIRKIVTDLKDYARGPSQLEGSSVPTDVNQAILYACRLLKHAITLGTKHFTQDLTDALPPVRADRLKLTQVMVNILENAIQSLPSPDAAVSIRTFTEPVIVEDGSVPWVCVLVVDEGQGMDPHTLAAVFDPFFTTKRDRGGTGLGMPVALGIVRELGGTIELRSSIGGGTTVLVRIPSCQEPVGGCHDT